MPCVEPDSESYAVGCVFQIRIGKHNLWVLPAKLEAQLLEVAGCSMDAVATDSGRTGERDHVDVHVLRHGLSDDAAGTGDHIVDAIGQARLLQHLGKEQSRCGCHL